MVDPGYCGLCVLFYLLEFDGDPGAPLSVGCEFCSVLPPSVSCEPWCTPQRGFWVLFCSTSQRELWTLVYTQRGFWVLFGFTSQRGL
jgi:hypothetical protein